MRDKKLRKRLLKLLFDHKEEHVGSCFSCLDIIDKIHARMNEDDVFVLSNGHAAYALYCILEKYYGIDADKLVEKHLGHPNMDIENKIYCSTGSLGQGITIATGAAIASPHKNVYVTITDGECAEGSVWESLRLIHDMNLRNIEVHVNANGYACYDPVDTHYLEKRCKAFLPDIHFHKTKVNELSFLAGIDAHYMKLTEDQYNIGLKEIDNECA